jgi:probable poly-beta-1,6-N-acetyl-D-glucosamine export protein
MEMLIQRKTEFLDYIHSFRAIAIIFVVATHVVGDLSWKNTNPIYLNLLSSLMQNGSVMFVFVAGFLFQHTSGNFQYHRYLWTKLKNVITPYIIITTVDLLYHYFRGNGIFGSGYPHQHISPVLDIARIYLTGAEIVPMWFVPMIALFYVLAPVLLAIDRRPRLYLMLPPLTLVAMFIHRPDHLTSIMQATIYFLPAYLSGMWLSHYRESAIAFLRKSRWIFIGVCLALIVTEVFFYKHGGAIFSLAPFSTEAGVVDIDVPLKLTLSFVLVEIFQKYDNRIKGKLNLLAGASFGIFFLHDYAIWFLVMVSKRLGFPNIQGGPIQFVVLLATVVAVSLLLVLAIRRIIGRYSRFLIGC